VGQSYTHIFFSLFLGPSYMWFDACDECLLKYAVICCECILAGNDVSKSDCRSHIKSGSFKQRTQQPTLEMYNSVWWFTFLHYLSCAMIFVFCWHSYGVIWLSSYNHLCDLSSNLLNRHYLLHSSNSLVIIHSRFNHLFSGMKLSVLTME